MPSEVLTAVQQSVAPVAILILLGYVWKRTAPAGMEATQTRSAINALVMYAFYPALIYHVVSHVTFGSDFFWVPVFIWGGLFISAAVAFLIFRTRCFGALAPPQLGALILACAFGNILSMGISVLQPLYGDESARYAIYGDVLGLSVLFWTFGAGLSSRMGVNGEGRAGGLQLARTLLRLPPIWAFFLALTINVLDLPNPVAVDRAADLLGRAAVPSMLLTVGLSFTPSALHKQPRILLTAAFIKLVLMPGIVALVVLPLFGISEMSSAIILLSGMPTMMATMILADRFQLDTELLASVLVATTILFFLILPVWLILLI